MVTDGELESQTEAIISAERLLSSMETWSAVDKNHRAETPVRMVKALRQMTTRQEFNFTTFPATGDEMVTLGPIPFYTLCAHHVLPFYGDVWVSYVPRRLIAGLSKFSRAVEYMAKGFWVQEEYTTALTTWLEARLEPQGLGVVVKAEHLCMAMRGVETAGVITTTSCMRGVYADHTRTAKAEFLAEVRSTNATR